MILIIFLLVLKYNINTYSEVDYVEIAAFRSQSYYLKSCSLHPVCKVVLLVYIQYG